MEYTYYPGCSLEASSSFYDTSTRLMCEKLGIKLNELEDWNCCGATSYISVDEKLSFSISARNLALAEKYGNDLVASCSACYCNLKKTNEYMLKYADLKAEIDEALAAGGLEYKGTIRVRHLLDVVVNDIPGHVLKAKMTRGLKGLKVAPYYGCQMLRPMKDFDDQESPVTMDRLIEDMGGVSVYFPHKAKCCGGSLTFNAPDVAYHLIKGIFLSAIKGGAEAIITTCPLCQANLDLYQSDINKKYGTDFNIPVLFFTQLLGFCLGAGTKELGFDKTIVSADEVIRRIA